MKHRRQQMRTEWAVVALIFAMMSAVSRPAIADEEAQQQPAAPPVEISEQRMNFFMSMPGFTGLLGAVAKVNKAMRDAAENPMDKWRRQNVQTAVAAMPGAIQGLAAEFMSGKLHDGDYPAIQGILGGFVDVAAADGYKKFLRNPDPSYIPQVGGAFPKNVLSSATVPSTPEAAAAAAASAGAAPQQKESAELASLKKSGELVDLTESLTSLIREPASVPETGDVEGVKSIGFDESASIGGADPNSFLGQAVKAQVEAAKNADEEGAANGSPGFLQGVYQDLLSLEGKEDEKEKCNPEEDEMCVEDEDIFVLDSDEENKKKKQAAQKKQKKKSEKKEDGAHDPHDGHDHSGHDHSAHSHPKVDPKNFQAKKTINRWRSSFNDLSFLAGAPSLALAQNEEDEDRPLPISTQCHACLLNNADLPGGAAPFCVERGLCTPFELGALEQELSGGGGGGGSQSLTAQALGIISGSLSAMGAQIGTAAAGASAAKHGASEAARESTTNTKTAGALTRALSNLQNKGNEAQNQTTLAIVKGQLEGKKDRDGMSIAGVENQNDFVREQARFDRELENYKAGKQFEMQLYAMTGQFNVQKYLLRMQGLMGGGSLAANNLNQPINVAFGGRFQSAQPSLLSSRGSSVGALSPRAGATPPASFAMRFQSYANRSAIQKTFRSISGSYRDDRNKASQPTRAIPRNPAVLRSAPASTHGPRAPGEKELGYSFRRSTNR